MPADLKPPRVNLSFSSKVEHVHELLGAAATLPLSPLGVWYLDGAGCESFLDIVETVLAYSSCEEAVRGGEDADLYERIGRLVHMGAVPGNFTQARGRRNLNLKAVPPVDVVDESDLDPITTNKKAASYE